MGWDSRKDQESPVSLSVAEDAGLDGNLKKSAKSLYFHTHFAEKGDSGPWHLKLRPQFEESLNCNVPEYLSFIQDQFSSVGPKSVPKYWMITGHIVIDRPFELDFSGGWPSFQPALRLAVSLAE
ncbi:MAG: hypothetical protein DWI24_00540 [Planctomycetota bacterium]|nr:MAG: hypothetical protein DWI24_00540 [Planctomycetota bacterium]